jgi:hypothetical protein
MNGLVVRKVTPQSEGGFKRLEGLQGTRKTLDWGTFRDPSIFHCADKLTPAASATIR